MKISAVLITKEKEYPKEIVLEGFDEVLIRTESPDVYTRYLLAHEAKNDIIYVQDDDAIVNYKALKNYYNGRLTNGMTEHHTEAYKGTGITLVGWGCYFPKRMLRVFKRYIEKYGVDANLKRDADRVFTYLNQPHNSVIIPHVDINQDKPRMSHEAQHYNQIPIVLAKLRLLTR